MTFSKTVNAIYWLDIIFKIGKKTANVVFNQLTDLPLKAFMKKPCAECPWRTDVCTGRFPADRFRILAPTAYDMNMVQFACHKSPEGEEVGCAGYVLRGSLHNIGALICAAWVTDPIRG